MHLLIYEMRHFNRYGQGGLPVLQHFYQVITKLFEPFDLH
jgi:hypothetical protein